MVAGLYKDKNHSNIRFFSLQERGLEVFFLQKIRGLITIHARRLAVGASGPKLQNIMARWHKGLMRDL
jgi:hypothetical protein